MRGCFLSFTVRIKKGSIKQTAYMPESRFPGEQYQTGGHYEMSQSANRLNITSAHPDQKWQ